MFQLTDRFQHIRMPFPLMLVILIGFGTIEGAGGWAQEKETIEIREVLALSRVGRSGRSILRADPIQAMIAKGTWTAPKEGDPAPVPAVEENTDGVWTQEEEPREANVWRKIQADEGGVFRDRAFRGGYAFCTVESDQDKIMLLEPAGHSWVYANGELRAGDVYSYGNGQFPVVLKKGTNEILFQVARGQLRAKLTTPASPYLFNDRDCTLPDLLVGEETNTWGAIVVINATTKWAENLAIQAELEEGGATVTPVPDLPPLSIRKVGFHLEGAAPAEPKKVNLKLSLLHDRDGKRETVSTYEIKLDIFLPKSPHKITFISRIDGSVQYYGVNPANPLPGDDAPKALFLSTHGASVEGIGMARAYSPKSWGHIVSPTNRRPYGFDWEDWGRWDALEVLELAQQRYAIDPAQIYLTGHSMGGHGAWSLGVLFPDRWAAIAPSAGWVSFWSYRQGNRQGLQNLLTEKLSRSNNASDTKSLAKNYLHHGVYILHGADDDNVPAREAREMNEFLKTFHHDFYYHEQPQAGHWWDASDDAGTDCVDWLPMFDFFARHRRPANDTIRQVDFITVSPGVSARCNWATVDAQFECFQPSTISIRYDPGLRRFAGTTENVQRLAFDVAHIPEGGPLKVQLDNWTIEGIAYPRETKQLWLEREAGVWSVITKPSPALKGAHRYGPFKDAFRNRMLFVYGTKGTPEENAWAFQRARYDAETFWYRGNGSIDVIPDTAFDPAREPDRNVILYGNATTNAAWAALLGQSDVQVTRGMVQAASHQFDGDDLACLFLKPRPDSDIACVAVIGGTGVEGMRSSDTMSLFTSGTGLPDCVVFRSNLLDEGTEKGIVAAGFFGRDWSVRNGEFAWQR